MNASKQSNSNSIPSTKQTLFFAGIFSSGLILAFLAGYGLGQNTRGLEDLMPKGDFAKCQLPSVWDRVSSLNKDCALQKTEESSNYEDTYHEAQNMGNMELSFCNTTIFRKYETVKGPLYTYQYPTGTTSHIDEGEFRAPALLYDEMTNSSHCKPDNEEQFMFTRIYPFGASLIEGEGFHPDPYEPGFYLAHSKYYRQDTLPPEDITKHENGIIAKIQSAFPINQNNTEHSSMEQITLLVMAILGLIGIGIYFLPTILAVVFKNRNLMAIVIINLLLGWIGIGWIIALVMAVWRREPQVQPVIYQGVQVSPSTTEQTEKRL